MFYSYPGTQVNPHRGVCQDCHGAPGTRTMALASSGVAITVVASLSNGNRNNGSTYV
ncbi:MAG: hypothetical protein JWR48_1830 [Mycobacterium sp.]|nr:hypothetical protein [Mycobacterium sp.]